MIKEELDRLIDLVERKLSVHPEDKFLLAVKKQLEDYKQLLYDVKEYGLGDG